MSPPLFPMKFCATRWVENEMVASRTKYVGEYCPIDEGVHAKTCKQDAK